MSYHVSNTSMMAGAKKTIKYISPDDLLNVYGNRQWHQANADAKTVLWQEPAVDHTGVPLTFKPISGVEKAYDYVVQRYLEYVVLLKAMSASMGRLLHPQKRLLFKRFIEAVACRVCELKSEMIKLSSTNIHSLLRWCQYLNMTPDQFEYNIPESMLQDQVPAMKQREKLLNLLLRMLESKPDCGLADLLTLSANIDHYDENIFEPPPKDHADSVDLSENKEGKDRDSKASVISTLSDYSSSFSSKRKGTGSVDSTSTKSDASGGKPPPFSKAQLEVQAFVSSRRYKEMLCDHAFHNKIRLLLHRWRLWIGRKDYNRDREILDAFLHMRLPNVVPEPAKKTISELAARYIPNKTLIAARQASGTQFGRSKEEEATIQQALCRQEELEASLKTLEEEYLTGSEGAYDTFALQLNIKQWILELRDLLGKRPVYPEPEQGGCQALFSHRTVAEVEEELDELEEKEKAKKAAKDKDKKDKKDKKEKKEDKKKKEDAKGKGKGDKEEGFLWDMPRSASLPVMMQAWEEYAMYWNAKLEPDNVEQRIDLQLAKETVRADAEEKIRGMVDSMMVAELDRLRAVDREKPPKPGKKDKKKEKRGSKKRRKKDPLDGRSVEELYSELVLAGIASKPQRVNLDEYVGAPNFSDSRREINCLATPLDLKMALREMFGMPLCSSFIHSSVSLRNSLLLAGPTGVGKSLLVNGLCKETGSNLFNLSPTRMVGKYQGKKNEDYLMNVLMKVSKSIEPTIILVEDCHLLFPTKKAPKQPELDRDRPARWVRILSRMMKKFVPGDRVLLVGVTSHPFFAKTGAMCKLFQSPFLVPFPEYATRLALWQHCLRELKFTRPPEVNASNMAKLTEGYTGSDIKAAIAKVCTVSRQESKRRLRNAEFLPALAASFPDPEAPSPEDWVKWYLATPMMQARQKLIDGIVREEEELATAKTSKKR